MYYNLLLLIKVYKRCVSLFPKDRPSAKDLLGFLHSVNEAAKTQLQNPFFKAK